MENSATKGTKNTKKKYTKIFVCSLCTLWQENSRQNFYRLFCGFAILYSSTSKADRSPNGEAMMEEPPPVSPVFMVQPPTIVPEA
jgi:hypothetical protein